MPEIIICYPRCMYCRRRTPHETCHDHSEELHPGWWEALEALMPVDDIVELLWGTGADETELCGDPACPLWEPGEWERQQRASMTTLASPGPAQKE